MTTEVAVYQQQQQAMEVWDESKLDLIQKQLAPDLSPPEFRLFVEVCQASGLNPVTREIYAIKRGGRVTYQTGIDGYRKLARASGRYAGSKTFWCGDDGQWRDVWLPKEPPAAAKVIIFTPDGEFEHVALFREYVQKGKDGQPAGMWATMAANQLAKCAEAGALRKACPAEFKGIYVEDELHQADNPRTSLEQPGPQHTTQKGRGAGRDALRESKPAAREPWMDDLNTQAKEGWNQSIHEAFGDLFGNPVTVKGMRTWAATLPEGTDLYKAAVDWWMANKRPSVLDAMEAGDEVEGEVIDGEATEVPFGD